LAHLQNFQPCIITNSNLADFRQKDTYDDAIPSGNSIELLNLIKLSRTTSDNGLEEKALEILQSSFEIIKKAKKFLNNLILR
jgi:uncharacterized protein YyaL (SSP411 family)